MAIQTETAELTPQKSAQTVTPDSGKYFDKVIVDAIPSDYVIPSGTQQITENGTYDVSGKASAVVNVETGTDTSDGNIEPTTVLKGYKGYAKGMAVTGTIETWDGSYEAISNFVQVQMEYKSGNTYIMDADTSKKYTVRYYDNHGAGPGYHNLEFYYNGTTWSGSGTIVGDTSYPNAIVFHLNGGYASLAFKGIALEGDDYADDGDFAPYKYQEDVVAYWLCLIEGTLITLANGTKKAIEDITYDDDLLVWNFYEGKLDSAKPTWIKIPQTTKVYNLCKFNNGVEVGFVGEGGTKGYHRIYNDEAKAFTHTGVEETPIGTTTFAEDGSMPTLVSQELVEKEVKFYNIITDKHYNLFANGILTSCKLSNKYAIDNMKYVGECLISDKEEQEYMQGIDELKLERR